MFNKAGPDADPVLLACRTLRPPGAEYSPYCHGIPGWICILTIKTRQATNEIFVFKIPFPYVVASAALGGLLMQRQLPEVFCKGDFDPESGECRITVEPDAGQKITPPSWSHMLRVFLVCLCLWVLVVGAVWTWQGSDGILTRIALFFTKAAFVTFGGAYAVLSYINEVAVGSGWLSSGQMLIGLGLAETTPGPLIMVTQYVGFLGAWTLPGSLPPLTAGILGALITTYVTFLPCFFFIFAGAPYIETMAGNPGCTHRCHGSSGGRGA